MKYLKKFENEEISKQDNEFDIKSFLPEKDKEHNYIIKDDEKESEKILIKIQKFNDFGFNPMISENTSERKEIKNFGFLQSDLLTTAIINGNNAKLYLFNWGTYPKVRHYLDSISMNDAPKIEDWLCDRFNDENMNIDATIISINKMSKFDINDSDILNKYPEGEIANDCIEIKFTIN